MKKQPIPAKEYQLAIHTLNQRYMQEWDRAERLQDELEDIKSSRAFRLLAWWRRLAGYWRKRKTSPSDSARQPGLQGEVLDPCQQIPVGKVSILIPFKDRLDLLRGCVRSVRRSLPSDGEILLLDNGSSCSRTLRYLSRGQGASAFRVADCSGPFNFSKICNTGAKHAIGDFLVFLNNDTEVLAPDWLEHLLRLANQPSVGIVGATLLYPDGTIQHAGLRPRKDGQWSHVYRGFPQDHPGSHGELGFSRTVPAVTGACLMIRRSLFHEMGGFDEKYPVTFNDVDLCQRVWARGLKVAISPEARLLHFESLSRGFSRDASPSTSSSQETP